ncbi:MAG: PilZ domain-containing protein [Proteobacteria bacterium]|nr:PilZ domain-containing protein [Pseudomonadota bacterium]MBU1714390.1 PilZ domain-containing protein [Pseudomonadota bacterium]
MSYNWADRRKHERVYFLPTDDVTGSISLLDRQESITVPVLNMSLGGLYFTIKRSNSLSFKANNTIVLNEIKTAGTFDLTANIMLEVRRVQNHNVFEFVGYGCEFVEMNEQTANKLARFLKWELAKVVVDQTRVVFDQR